MKTRQPNQIPDALKSIDVKAILRRRGVYVQQKQNQLYKEVALPLAREMLSKNKKTSKSKYNPQFTETQIRAYCEKQIHLVETVEKHFENKLVQYIHKIEKGFLAYLDSEFNQKNIKKLKVKGYFDDNEDELLTMAGLDFTPLLESVATLAGQNALKLINSDEIYIPFKYREQISRNVDKFAHSIIDTDKQILTDILSRGISDGHSMAEIRNQIAEVFPEYTKSQAQRVTVTEVSRASIQATEDAWEQSGVVEGKQWVIFGAVDECADYDGDIIALGENFYGMDNEFQDGDPPIHPNCKCQVIPILIDSKAFVPSVNKALHERIAELEGQIDKRTKDFKELKIKSTDDEAYIKSLEAYLGVDNE